MGVHIYIIYEGNSELKLGSEEFSYEYFALL